MSGHGITLRPARPEDVERIRTLLEGFGLPVEDIAGLSGAFIVAETADHLAGTVALEVYGDTGLLRSAAVVRALQGRGVGVLLHDAAIERARELGLRRVVLLTTTAERFFAARGFRRVPRESVTGPVTMSAEFAALCPATAVCMERTL